MSTAISASRSTATAATTIVRTSANSTATQLTGVASATGTSAPPSYQCNGNSFLTIPDAFPACAIQVNSNVSTIALLGDCCNGAPSVRYNNNCHAYCEARNQTVERLHDCLTTGLRNANGFAGSLPILCNRAGVSYSSLLPANTEDPATRTTPGATSSATPSGNAANSLTRGSSAREQKFLSFGAWTTVVLFVASGFAAVIA